LPKEEEKKREEKISGNNNTKTMTETPDDNDQLFATIPKIYFGDGPTIVDSRQITQAPDTAAVTAAQGPGKLPPYFIVFLLLLFLFLGFGAFVYLQRRKDKRKIELK
tara:strand:+ start:675 stop:995 length:321 start_codon:yes stop_codon:yes gene_type:complete